MIFSEKEYSIERWIIMQLIIFFWKILLLKIREKYNFSETSLTPASYCFINISDTSACTTSTQTFIKVLLLFINIQIIIDT